MYRIGLFSKLGRVTIKTLHFYDETGLLVPDCVDEESGYRYYSSNQLFRLNEIVALRQMGFSISEIATIVDGHNIDGILEQRRLELEREVQTVTSQLFRLTNYIKEQKEGQTMKYQAVVKEIPGYLVYSTQYTLPDYAALMEIMSALGEKVSKANPELKCVEPGYCFNVYLDSEYRDTDIRIETCEAVTSRGKDGDGIIFKEIPPVTAVTVLHPGAYEEIGAAYAYAVKWAEQNGYQITGNVRESHIDGIWNKEDVAEWLTEIQVPVEKK